MTTAFYVAALSLPFFSEMAMANMSVYPMELNVDRSGAAQIKVASKTDSMVTPVFATPILTTSWLA